MYISVVSVRVVHSFQTRGVRMNMMSTFQLAIVLAAIIILGYVGLLVLTKSIQALGPRFEAAILKRGEERVVILKNQGVSVRDSTGNIWEETIPLEPGVKLITQLEAIVADYVALDRACAVGQHSRADWLWVEMLRSTDGLGQDHRVLIARMAEFAVTAASLRRPSVEIFEPATADGNGDHDHEPLLATGAEVSAG